MKPGSGLPGQLWPQTQKMHREGGATLDPLNSTAQTTETPVQVMGSIRLMEATPFHFECLCIRVTLVSKFT